MNKILGIIIFIIALYPAQESERLIARQGRVSFFSHTPVEDIKAENNQVLSIIDASNSEIAVSMLMKAFIFEKALMREHFNESYIESDIYPRATFMGKIMDFDPNMPEVQTRIIKGDFTLRGITKELSIKADIIKSSVGYIIEGNFETLVDDYDIKIPPLLAGNIAETINVNFRFEFEPYHE